MHKLIALLSLTTFAANAFAQDTRVDAAVAFIQTKLSAVLSRNLDGAWIGSNLMAVGPHWTWKERLLKGEAPTQTLSGTDDTYSVDVRKLVFPVVLTKSSITLECRDPECFSVRSNSWWVVGDGKREDTTTTFKTSSNTWLFNSPEEAARVSNALNDSLLILGAARKAY